MSGAKREGRTDPAASLQNESAVSLARARASKAERFVGLSGSRSAMSVTFWVMETQPGRKGQTEHGKVLVVNLSSQNPLHSDFAGAMLDRLLKNLTLSTYAKSNVELNFSKSFRRLSQEAVRKRLLGLFDQLRALGYRHGP
jgi:hypothetical protein